MLTHMISLSITAQQESNAFNSLPSVLQELLNQARVSASRAATQHQLSGDGGQGRESTECLLSLQSCRAGGQVGGSSSVKGQKLEYLERKPSILAANSLHQIPLE